ncbi:MAG: diguanylate cyclase [Arcobacter sp.]|nr:diguanylate cyclase [Arcobacter sp.]
MKKLLVVDNSKLIINFIKDSFYQNHEFTLYSARNFEESKTLIEEHNFFAALTNFVLSDALNGELLKLLKHNNIPTVVITAKIDNSVLNIMRSVNVVDYISKNSMIELESACKLVKLLTFIQNIEVLVVDDSPVVVEKIKYSLESLLLKVHKAKNGIEALSVLEEKPKIALIVTDHNMDKMNGLDLIKSIRKSQLHSSIPILIMTTSNNNDLKIQFFKNGATDFLLKPVLEEELKSKIINIFSDIKQMDDIENFTKVLDDHVISSRCDEHGIITHVSKAFCNITGYSKNELIGKSHTIFRHPDMDTSIFQDLWNTIKSGNTWKYEMKNLKKDGTTLWLNTIIQPNLDRNNNITSFTAIREDITDKKRIYELSITDSLTSLYNRRHFNELAPSLIENTLRDNNIFSFVILDIDNFKKYNDNYGHQEGDNVLIEVSNSLKKSFQRSSDIVFRLGGEEFGVLIKSKSEEDTIKIVEKARDNIESLNIEHKLNTPKKVITASFGLSIIKMKKSKVDLDYIYKKTDDALYEAKDTGRNKISIVYI